MAFNVIQLLEPDLHYCITEATSFKTCKDAFYKAFFPSCQLLAYLDYLPQMFSRNFRSCSDYLRKLKKVIALANLGLAGSDDRRHDDTDLKAAFQNGLEWNEHELFLTHQFTQSLNDIALMVEGTLYD